MATAGAAAARSESSDNAVNRLTEFFRLKPEATGSTPPAPITQITGQRLNASSAENSDNAGNGSTPIALDTSDSGVSGDSSG
jgi:hypothetical protein